MRSPRLMPAPARTAPSPARPVRTLLPVLLVLLVSSLTALGGCGLRMGEGTPASLPSVSQAEAARDSLARQAVLIASSAAAVSASGGPQAEAAAGVQAVAEAQVEALGGVWDPWATEVPSTFPTASPVATAGEDTTAEDLVTALSEGVSLARETAVAAESAQDARLYTSLAASWTVQVETVAPDAAGSVAAQPRSSLDTGEQVSPGLLVTYDAARYALQQIAARTESTTRQHATSDAEDASAVVNAALAVGSEDTRPGAYAAPAQATQSSDPDTAWAQAVWSDVTAYEVQEAGSTQAGSSARTAAVEAAADAALRATAWGSGLPSLPGYSAS